VRRISSNRDRNETAIVAAFRAHGWSVAFLTGNGVPDLAVAKGDKLYLVEVKQRKGTFTPAQVKWHADWRGPKPVIVRSVDDAIKLVGGA
jgi:Holliday junction resolvase